MMVGFRARLAEELRHLLAEVPPYKERLSIEDVRLHSPPTKTNYTCWTGASVFGATDAIITRYYYTFMLRGNLSSHIMSCWKKSIAFLVCVVSLQFRE